MRRRAGQHAVCRPPPWPLLPCSLSTHIIPFATGPVYVRCPGSGRTDHAIRAREANFQPDASVPVLPLSTGHAVGGGAPCGGASGRGAHGREHDQRHHRDQHGTTVRTRSCRTTVLLHGTAPMAAHTPPPLHGQPPPTASAFSVTDRREGWRVSPVPVAPTPLCSVLFGLCFAQHECWRCPSSNPQHLVPKSVNAIPEALPQPLASEVLRRSAAGGPPVAQVRCAV
jgi:hypothetical protein